MRFRCRCDAYCSGEVEVSSLDEYSAAIIARGEIVTCHADDVISCECEPVGGYDE